MRTLIILQYLLKLLDPPIDTCKSERSSFRILETSKFCQYSKILVLQRWLSDVSDKIRHANGSRSRLSAPNSWSVIEDSKDYFFPFFPTFNHLLQLLGALSTRKIFSALLERMGTKILS
ncbi:hypothetical protein EUGRSUZ_I02551 [Eucalyptus grandis]|uniref:Uncharacterized protein n=2 Tax=Eucalyptus grandis TaxID=71139 RepID=A0ACC3JIF7_EUCGR|nr:hypothetical protein EUGRSUZ_I02551 [Eucalyptus grandis]